MQTCEVRAYAHAQLRVEVRQRFVHEVDARTPRDRARHRDALTLSAGEGERTSVHQVLEPEQARGLVDPFCDLLARRPAHFEAERDVLAHGHMRVERVVLEDHRDVATLRIDVSHVAIADQDGSVGHLLEPRDAAQQRRLSATGRADEHDEFAVFDQQIDSVDRALPIRERLLDCL